MKHFSRSINFVFDILTVPLHTEQQEIWNQCNDTEEALMINVFNHFLQPARKVEENSVCNSIAKLFGYQKILFCWRKIYAVLLTPLRFYSGQESRTKDCHDHPGTQS